MRSLGIEESEVKLVDPFALWVTVIEGTLALSPLPDRETDVVIG